MAPHAPKGPCHHAKAVLIGCGSIREESPPDVVLLSDVEFTAAGLHGNSTRPVEGEGRALGSQENGVSGKIRLPEYDDYGFTIGQAIGQIEIWNSRKHDWFA